jgi:tetratricopeptide (TPR) repeat protein
VPLESASHLDPETMAVYADGKLSAAERNRVHLHIAACEQCAEVLSDLMTCLAETREAAPPPVMFRSRRRMLVVGGLAMAAVTILAIWVGKPGRMSWFSGAQSSAEFTGLIAAYANEPNRPADGRLSVPFQYGSPPAVTRGGSSRERLPDTRIAASQIEAAVRTDITPGGRHALGIARLALGDSDGAIAALDEAAAAAPRDAAIANDLAAAYLERARMRSSEQDRQQALAAATRALAISPDLQPALFNKALALAALGRGNEADAAWRAFQQVERDPQWIAEATRRMGRRQD